MLLPHTSRPLREPKHIANRTTPTGEERFSDFEFGGGRNGPTDSNPPETSPRCIKPNAASPRRQFTLSYRLLPFSGRTPVRTLPKIGAGKSFAHPRNVNRRRQPRLGDSAVFKGKIVEKQGVGSGIDPGCRAKAAPRSWRGAAVSSVCLPAQEGRNVEVIRFRRVMHSASPADAAPE